MRAHIIFNPASAAGATGKRRREFERASEARFGKSRSFSVTQGPHDATSLTRSAVQEGYELIVAIGGDGTINEIVNGFFSNGRLINPACELGIISSGTGQGFAQSLGLPKAMSEQIDVLCDQPCRTVDVGRVFFESREGARLRRVDRYFVNECQAGIGGAVVEEVKKQYKWFGGLLGFGVGSLLKVVTHNGQSMDVVLDGKTRITDRFIGIIVANGAYAAGGMNLAPRAQVDDGLFDVVLIHEQSLFRRLRAFSKVYSGKHIASAGISYYQSKSLSISSNDRVLLEADGELLGFLPCNVEVLPKILRVKSSQWKER